MELAMQPDLIATRAVLLIKNDEPWPVRVFRYSLETGEPDPWPEDWEPHAHVRTPDGAIDLGDPVDSDRALAMALFELAPEDYASFVPGGPQYRFAAWITNADGTRSETIIIQPIQVIER